MAIIKCPECGRQISDKAPTCPNCGVEIAGKIIRCPQCGEVYFNNQEVCPNCHHLTYGAQDTHPHTHHHEVSPVVPPAPPVDQAATPANTPPKKGKGKMIALTISLFIATFICGLCFYFYNNAKQTKEENAFEFAMKSDDPLVLQTYLDNNLDAPEEHITAITARLETLKKQDNDWANALVSGSKTALLDYIAKHPDSEHIDAAKHKIDSLDWTDALNENTLEAIQLYITQHATGEHLDEANTAIRELKAKTVQSDEKTMVVGALRHFFQSINAKDEAALGSSVSPILSNFLGKTDATRADVITFMYKIYKDDITNMTWRLNNDYQINKKEIGVERYEYTVNFSSIEQLHRTGTDDVQEVKFLINATINPDGQISAMTMTKVLE